MSLLRWGLVCGLAVICLPRDAAAAISAFEPDAWTRGNDADTSWFGWDVLETDVNDPILGTAQRVLDDDSPDVGGATTAVMPRIYQGANGAQDSSPTVNGHRSNSGNYYSWHTDVANDTIFATAPASGSGGSTTVVLQVLSQAGQETRDLQFTMGAPWTKAKDLYAINSDGAGMYWQEWTAAGNDLPFSILMTSTTTSRAIDSFQVDTFWTPSDVPRINAIAAIPEPGSVTLAGLALVGSLFAFGKRRIFQR